MGEDRWWLATSEDRDLAAVPLADRVEWAVFSLLSTAGPLSEPAFLDRIAGLFSGPDLPDEALVRACLDSYRSLASTPDRLATGDDLVQRSEEHARLIAVLVDLGHRLGFQCWVGERQQPRKVDGWTLGDHLGDRELAGPPSLGRLAARDLEDVDVLWYVRGRWCSRGRSSGRRCCPTPSCGATRASRTTTASCGCWSCSPSARSWCGTSSSARRCCATASSRAPGT